MKRSRVILNKLEVLKNFFLPMTNVPEATPGPRVDRGYFKQYMYIRPNQRKIRKRRRQTGNYPK